MKFTILIPHWKTGKMTAYAVAQFLKLKGRHEVDIIIINNHPGDGSEKYITQAAPEVTIVDYPPNLEQTHGVAFDYILPHIKTDYFIASESDAFPTADNWLDFYENIIHDGVDCAGSLLKLSGGEYVHPCGALYKTDSWWQAKKYCDEIEFDYYPNMAMKEGFACHTMIHKSVRDEILAKPDDYIELNKDLYLPYSVLLAEQQRVRYLPICGPFHNGMGEAEESYYSYGKRTINTEASKIILTNRRKLIRRIGYEPGQWFCYWHFAMKKNVIFIPTETKWIHNREGTQQEYTMMNNGFKHLWGITAWSQSDPASFEYARIKQPIPERLYNTLPEHQKILV